MIAKCGRSSYASNRDIYYRAQQKCIAKAAAIFKAREQNIK